jgi:hypothetical protein
VDSAAPRANLVLGRLEHSHRKRQVRQQGGRSPSEFQLTASCGPFRGRTSGTPSDRRSREGACAPTSGYRGLVVTTNSSTSQFRPERSLSTTHLSLTSSRPHRRRGAPQSYRALGFVEFEHGSTIAQCSPLPNMRLFDLARADNRVAGAGKCPPTGPHRSTLTPELSRRLKSLPARRSLQKKRVGAEGGTWSAGVQRGTEGGFGLPAKGIGYRGRRSIVIAAARTHSA